MFVRRTEIMQMEIENNWESVKRIQLARLVETLNDRPWRGRTRKWRWRSDNLRVTIWPVQMLAQER
jgi:hypothetical protein